MNHLPNSNSLIDFHRTILKLIKNINKINLINLISKPKLLLAKIIPIIQSKN